MISCRRCSRSLRDMSSSRRTSTDHHGRLQLQRRIAIDTLSRVAVLSPLSIGRVSGNGSDQRCMKVLPTVAEPCGSQTPRGMDRGMDRLIVRWRFISLS